MSLDIQINKRFKFMIPFIEKQQLEPKIWKSKWNWQKEGYRVKEGEKLHVPMLNCSFKSNEQIYHKSQVEFKSSSKLRMTFFEDIPVEGPLPEDVIIKIEEPVISIIEPKEEVLEALIPEHLFEEPMPLLIDV